MKLYIIVTGDESEYPVAVVTRKPVRVINGDVIEITPESKIEDFKEHSPAVIEVIKEVLLDSMDRITESDRGNRQFMGFWYVLEYLRDSSWMATIELILKAINVKWRPVVSERSKCIEMRRRIDALINELKWLRDNILYLEQGKMEKCRKTIKEVLSSWILGR